MSSDMERSRNGYRGRHHTNSTNRNYHDDNRSKRGSYREHLSHNNQQNGNYLPRTSPNSGYNYRSSRSSLNSRPTSSRNGPSTHYRQEHNPLPSSLNNRTSNDNSSPSNYYDNRSSLSRSDRPSNRRDLYPSLSNEQPILSGGLLPSPPSYYSPTQSISRSRDRPLPLPSSQYIVPERERYLPSLSSSTYRNDISPFYRDERSIDHGSRNISNDLHMGREYQSPTSPSQVRLSARNDPYGDTHRTNDYNARSERYDIPSNRSNTSSRDYSIPSSTYRTDLYRSSSNVSMSSSSSYPTREQYPSDVNYRPMSQSRDYENIPSRTSLMDQHDDFSRNIRDRNSNEYHSSHRDGPTLKRSASRYSDNGPRPAKRPMRR